MNALKYIRLEAHTSECKKEMHAYLKDKHKK